MARAPGGTRIVLQLDPRVAFEALVLNRLERIPEARRQEWLRGLLVQGFRQECQGLKLAQEEAEPRPPRSAQGQGVSADRQTSAFAAWLANTAPPPDKADEAMPEAAEQNVPVGRAKPFAGLRKVIG
jgi:hypothetical protein